MIHDDSVGQLKNSYFRILSIEGGGIMGAFAAGALAQFEIENNRRIVDHFDLIAGTSTGGIIAIGLAMGFSAAEIRDFYKHEGAKIFPEVGLIGSWRSTLRHLISPKHSQDVLRRVLGKLLIKPDGTSFKIGDAQTRLLIPAYDGLSGRIYLFKTRHKERFRYDTDLDAVEVALATAAAPTYFKAARIEQHNANYVDGGVWANCPALCAVVEAVAFLGQSPDTIEILNVGTTTERFNTVAKVRSGIAGWNRGLINLFMSAQGESSQAMASLLAGNKLLDVNYISANGEFSLDDSSKISDLVGLGEAQAKKHEIMSGVAARFLNGRHVAPFVPETESI